MIESVMLFALGFLLSLLLTVIVAPAFWGRAVRLTTARIKASLPITEAEIRADKDQLRAQYAVRVHQLERTIESSKLSAARQMIELNRTNATLSELEENQGRVKAELEENQNARRVLEQTLADRIPKLESRLDEARRQLATRDTDIAELTSQSREMERAIADAEGINAQQSQELERMRIAMASRQDRDRRRFSELGVESDFALRNELSTLRHRAREQAGLIERLRADIAEARAAAETAQTMLASDANGQDGAALHPATNGATNGNGRSQPRPRGLAANLALVGADAPDPATLAQIQRLKDALAEQASEAEALRQKLTEAELSLQGGATGPESDTRVVELRRQNAVLQGEANQLREELNALQNAVQSESGNDGGSRLQARLKGLEQQLSREVSQSHRLKSELTSANERAARQAAHFMDEMKRFGTGRTAKVVGEGGSEAQEREVARNQAAAKAVQASGPKPNLATSGRASGPATSAPAMVAAPREPASAASVPPSERRQSPRSNRLLDRIRKYD